MDRISDLQYCVLLALNRMGAERLRQDLFAVGEIVSRAYGGRRRRRDPWTGKLVPGPQKDAFRATLSRAMSRLVERGFVERFRRNVYLQEKAYPVLQANTEWFPGLCVRLRKRGGWPEVLVPREREIAT